MGLRLGSFAASVKVLVFARHPSIALWFFGSLNVLSGCNNPSLCGSFIACYFPCAEPSATSKCL